LRLVFTRGRGRLDRLDVFRGSRLLESVACTQDRVLPNEMVHYALAMTLQQRGHAVPLPYLPLAAEEDGEAPVRDGLERLVEVFTSRDWVVEDFHPQELLDQYRAACESWLCAPLLVGTDDLEAVHLHMLTLAAQWHDIEPGESLTLMLR
jgi:hypothetical protein